MSCQIFVVFCSLSLSNEKTLQLYLEKWNTNSVKNAFMTLVTSAVAPANTFHTLLLLWKSSKRTGDCIKILFESCHLNETSHIL